MAMEGMVSPLSPRGMAATPVEHAEPAAVLPGSPAGISSISPAVESAGDTSCVEMPSTSCADTPEVPDRQATPERSCESARSVRSESRETPTPETVSVTCSETGGAGLALSEAPGATAAADGVDEPEKAPNDDDAVLVGVLGGVREPEDDGELPKDRLAVRVALAVGVAAALGEAAAVVEAELPRVCEAVAGLDGESVPDAVMDALAPDVMLAVEV